MKKLMSKLLLSALVAFGATNSIYPMDDEPVGYTEPVRKVYFEIATFVNAKTPQEIADRLAKLKEKIAKLSPAETKLRDNFTGGATIAEVIKNTRDNLNIPSVQIKQGLTEAYQLLEAKSQGK